MKKTIEQTKKIRQVRRRIFLWYKKHHRDLPWRKTRNPYRILVSEIMLQQTQVDRVIPKYKEFLRAFPSISALAQAKTADVIRGWKGLGYNRRALYVQKTAQAIINNHNGRFPKDLNQLKTLPGVGDYTARAILSFAFEQSVPMMDTNHRRFYQRVLFGVKEKGDKKLLLAAESMLPTRRAYDWNQALMDFGSQVCLTRKPTCDSCPVQQWCKAYPKILTAASHKKKNNKKGIPFKETDRYVRGRIIDALRDTSHISTTILRCRFTDIDDCRYERILTKMVGEGLIKKNKGRILLPD